MGVEVISIGCAHCIWDLYQTDLEDYHIDLKQARSTLASLYKQELFDWPVDLLGPKVADEGQSIKAAKGTAEKQVEEEIAGLDPMMKAFLNLERKLKKKKAERAKAAEVELLKDVIAS